VLSGVSAIDGQLYCLKFYAHAATLSAEAAMLGQRELALVLPPARHVDGHEARAALTGLVIVSRAGTSLEQVFARDAAALQTPQALVRALCSGVHGPAERGCPCFSARAAHLYLALSRVLHP
jgi:hypothetical protein